MSLQNPHRRRPDDHFWNDRNSTPNWAKVIATLIVAAGLGAAIAIFVSRSSGGSTKSVRTETVRHTVAKASTKSTRKESAKPKPVSMPPATKTSRKEANGSTGKGSGGRFLGANATVSFESMAASLPAKVGLAVEPLGSEEVLEFGSLLSSGHAWSSIKPAILATVLKEQKEELGSEEEAWAEAAITASDNEAAASLFRTIEDRKGGLGGASTAVGEVIHDGGSTATTVATAPPPPGAVSTYGQTEWPVGEAVRFYHGLGRCEVIGASGTSYIESLMENVISEQRWGLGGASFPSGDRVGMKGGWGPDTEANNGYLVRQSGFIEDPNGGVAVAMIAIDESGSYPAGASDLTQVAQWLARELKGLGPNYHDCTG